MVVYWSMIAIGNYGGYFVALMFGVVAKAFVVFVTLLLFPCLSLYRFAHTNSLLLALFFHSVRLKWLFVYLAQLIRFNDIIDRGCLW